MQVGTRTAETLQAQGEQMERVLDTLHEIQFSMKKAGQVIRDITRGIATDKCACLAPHQPALTASQSCRFTWMCRRPMLRLWMLRRSE